MLLYLSVIIRPYGVICGEVIGEALLGMPELSGAVWPYGREMVWSCRVSEDG